MIDNLKKIIHFIVIFFFSLNINASLNNFLQDQNLQDEQVYFEAKNIEYDLNKEKLIAKDNIYIYYSNTHIRADRLVYDFKYDKLYVEGNVQVTDKQQRLAASNRIFFNDKFKSGLIKNLVINFNKNTWIASRYAEKLDEKHSNLFYTTYTSCPVCEASQPLWQIKAKETNIDLEKQEITYKHAFFEVKGHTIFYFPYFSHPTPGADARNGLLVPVFESSNVLIPYYIRLKPNMDLTISPKIYFNNKNPILNYDFNHLVATGRYNIKGSIKETDHSKYRNPRYHLFTNGNFREENYNYGFNFNRVSDKSYLKNYNYGNPNFLTSELYVNNINNADFFEVKYIDFQGLRAGDNKENTPQILPSLEFNKNLYNETLDSWLNIYNNNVFYTVSDTNILRASLDLELKKDFYSKSGNIFEITTDLKGDLYNIKQEDHTKNFRRFVPELQLKWRFPLINQYNEDKYLLLEPIVSTVIASNKTKNPIVNNDSLAIELSEYNIFETNRYSGFDLYEYGSRGMAGIESGIYSTKNSSNISLFLGQSFRYKHDEKLLKNSGLRNKVSDLVGRVSLNYQGNSELYYRFRKKPKKLNSNLDELGIWLNRDNLDLDLSYVLFRKEIYDSSSEKRLNKQIYSNLGYKFNKNIGIKYLNRYDISNSTPKLINYGVRLKYYGDCVDLSFKILNDKTHDGARNIKSNQIFSFSINVKTIGKN